MVGSNIRKLREEKNITQKDFAKKLGVSRQALCMWETNKRGLKATVLKKIAKILNVPIDAILNAEDFRKQASQNTSGPVLTKPRGKQEKKKIDFCLTAPKARRVLLTGDFNAWNSQGIPMKKDKGGIWRTGVSVEPGRYEYKFIVDDEWWTDPENDKIVNTALGTINSVMEVGS